MNRRSFFSGLLAWFGVAPAFETFDPSSLIREFPPGVLPIKGWLPVGKIPLQSDIDAELSAITRKAFLPKAYTQLYHQDPALAKLMERNDI